VNYLWKAEKDRDLTIGGNRQGEAIELAEKPDSSLFLGGALRSNFGWRIVSAPRQPDRFAGVWALRAEGAPQLAFFQYSG